MPRRGKPVEEGDEGVKDEVEKEEEEERVDQ